MDALLAQQASELDILNANLRMLAPRPRFGKQPTPEALAAAARQADAKREALLARHAEEAAAFERAAEAAAAAAAAGALDPPVAVPCEEAEDEAEAEEAEEEEEEEEEGGEAAAAPAPGPRRTRAERRRLKKEAAAVDAAAEEAAAAAAAGPPPPSAGALEMEALVQQLAPLRLGVRRVPGDGHCLFRAVSEQLELVGGGAAAHGHLALRARAADFIRAYWEDFAPFLPYKPEDGFPEWAGEAGAGMARDAVGRYCDRLAGSAMWGGHPELRALANVVGCSIVVYRARAAPLQFHPRGTEHAGEGASTSSVLRISYHAHQLALGEHYNTVVPR